MKCPQCKEEVSPGETCARCGSAAGSSDEGIQVEYKDFKGAELLDIKMPGQPAPGRPPVSPGAIGPPPKESDVRQVKVSPPADKPGANKPLIIAVVTAAVLSAAALYLLLRFMGWV